MPEPSEEHKIKKALLVEVFFACGEDVLPDLTSSNIDTQLVERAYNEYEQQLEDAISDIENERQEG
jgi:hypothetical protein